MAYEGSIDSSDVLLNRGLNGGYYGAGAYHTREAYDGTVVNNNVEANRQFGAVSTNRIIDSQKAEADRSRDAARFGTDALIAAGQSDKLNGITLTMLDRFNTLERDQANAALRAQECCCETKSAIAALDAKVECNQKVNEAFRAGKDQAILDAILLNTSGGRGQGNS